MTREIPLTRGKVALVDDADYEWLTQWKWSVRVRKHTCYARRTIRRRPFVGILTMHQALMGWRLGLEIDHENGNGLDNRRENLRWGTHADNVHNSGPWMRKTGRYKGVYWHCRLGKWEVAMHNGSKRIYVGVFVSEEEAAKAYDAVAKAAYGAFARLNFPDVPA